jgi:carbon-monoxide dehydrogenase large subunit
MSGTRVGGYIGRRVHRVNDLGLLAGGGSFVDDLHPPRMVHAHVVRAQTAHARIRSVDASEALLQPGIVDVITPEIASAALQPIRCVRVPRGQRIVDFPTLDTTVRYVGQPVALIVAESRAAAEDAAEMLEIEFEDLPVVVDALAAAEDGSPLLYPELGSNVVVGLEVGDPTPELDALFASAARVIERTFRIQRLAPTPLEPRGLVADWDGARQQLVVHWSSQTPHHVRDAVAHCMRLPASSVRVIVQGVGGGFGAKEHLYPDELLVCLAARRCGRPVKWIEDRNESFVGTLHARDQVYRARLALDVENHFLAIDAEVTNNLGAHPSTVGHGPAFAGQRMLEGPYRFRAAGSRSRGVVTCTTPTGAYRGFGMQESTWVRERLVDEAARELGLDPVTLRVHNMPAATDMPFLTRAGQSYDSGDYAVALERAASTVRRGRSDGRVRRGVGVASYVEMTGLAPSKVLAAGGFDVHGFESATVRVEPDGSVQVLTGTCPHGQGLETTLAQIAADRLGVPLETVRVDFGDTAVAPYSSTGTIASRSMVVGGAAVLRSADVVAGQIRELAGLLFEAAPEDIELADGMVGVAGVPHRAMRLSELAEKAWRGAHVPEGGSAGLEAKVVHEPKGTAYAYATHAVAVSVHLDTGEIRLDDYVVAHDCGVVVNPMIVDGQIHGGVAQGIGNALHEAVLYDPRGQPLTTTFLDYILPGSGEVPDMRLEHLETPAPDVPGGMKGVGEGGTIGPAAAIANAVADAVPEIAAALTETPLSPTAMWTLIREAGLVWSNEPE